MAEDVVEDVRLLEIVELLGPADEATGGEAPVGQVIKEHLIGHETRHRHNGPAGEGVELAVHLAEVGNAFAVQVQRPQAVEEGLAGAAGEQGGLSLVERDPDLMLFGRIARPVLVDGPVRPGALWRT